MARDSSQIEMGATIQTRKKKAKKKSQWQTDYKHQLIWQLKPWPLLKAYPTHPPRPVAKQPPHLPTHQLHTVDHPTSSKKHPQVELLLYQQGPAHLCEPKGTLKKHQMISVTSSTAQVQPGQWRRQIQQSEQDRR